MSAALGELAARLFTKLRKFADLALPTRPPSAIDLILQLFSPENGNIAQDTRRLSVQQAWNLPIPECGDNPFNKEARQRRASLRR